MKYLLLIHQNPDAFQGLSHDERAAVMAEAEALMNELVETGEWVSGEGLADPSATKSVRVRDGLPAVTDGPFAEAKEQVAGFCIVDCDSVERAVEIATRWPDARLCGMEVRPILSPDGVEM